MAFAQDFYLEIPNVASVHDAHWDTIGPVQIKLWSDLCDLLSEKHLEVDGVSYTLNVDWQPLLENCKSSYSTLKALHTLPKSSRTTENVNEILGKFPKGPTRLKVKVDGPREGSAASAAVADLVHNVFLIMNIAVPGSCDFYRARLIGEDHPPAISLSADNFEIALLRSFDRGWPCIGLIDLARVVSWFETVRPMATQIPKNPMERTLFACLHMARIDASAISIVWLFYAFESLLQTRPGENFSTIVARVCLLLEANNEQASIVRKRMRDLYNVRSAVVHGGFEVIHPLHNELLDDRVTDEFSKLIALNDWGQAFLLACIQKTIENGWMFPRFSEGIDGEPI
jgi:hypothetical protein